MLKSSEIRKLFCYSNYRFPNFKDCSEVRSADPQFNLLLNSKNRGPDENST